MLEESPFFVIIQTCESEGQHRRKYVIPPTVHSNCLSRLSRSADHNAGDSRRPYTAFSRVQSVPAGTMPHRTHCSGGLTMTSRPSGKDALRNAPLTSCLETCHFRILPSFNAASRDDGSACAVHDCSVGPTSAKFPQTQSQALASNSLVL